MIIAWCIGINRNSFSINKMGESVVVALNVKVMTEDICLIQSISLIMICALVWLQMSIELH